MEALCKQHVEVSKASAGCFHPIVIHSRTCSGCVPSLEQTRISGGRNNGFGKQILESFSVNSGNNNILAPSIVLTKGEIEFHTPELAYLFILHLAMQFFCHSSSVPVCPVFRILLPSCTLFFFLFYGSGLGWAQKCSAGKFAVFVLLQVERGARRRFVPGVLFFLSSLSKNQLAPQFILYTGCSFFEHLRRPI